MASSTADVAGAIEATCMALGYEISPHRVAELALAIEPTDGSMFPGIVLFDHRQGGLYQPLGIPPPINIIVLDFGKEVDTIAFNRHDHTSLLQALEPQMNKSLEMVCYGLTHSDPTAVGQGATLSARLNQQILFKPHLEPVISLASDVGALGVNVAHSGTVIGILLDAYRDDMPAIADFLARKLADVSQLFQCSLVGGGGKVVQISDKEELDGDNFRADTFQDQASG
jgi:L-threonine kinase